ncbi:SIMPL domain-containing protein [soil metagenome]
MQSNCGKFFSVLLLSIALVISFLGAGFFIAKAVYIAKKQDSFVTVKGLASREVKADLGLWEVDVREVGDNVVKLNQQLEKDQVVVVTFLKNKGFKDTEIEPRPAKVTDSLANIYNNPGNTEEALKRRYIITGGVRIRSNQVDLIQQVSQQTGELLGQNIPLSFDTSEVSPNPSYLLTGLDNIRPQMLAEATQSARLVADQFSKDSGSRLGAIRRASQGVFQIMSRDSSDIDSGAQQQLSSIYKKVRLVTTIDYFLQRGKTEAAAK